MANTLHEIALIANQEWCPLTLTSSIENKWTWYTKWKVGSKGNSITEDLQPLFNLDNRGHIKIKQHISCKKHLGLRKQVLTPSHVLSFYDQGAHSIIVLRSRRQYGKAIASNIALDVPMQPKENDSRNNRSLIGLYSNQPRWRGGNSLYSPISRLKGCIILELCWYESDSGNNRDSNWAL